MRIILALLATVLLVSCAPQEPRTPPRSTTPCTRTHAINTSEQIITKLWPSLAPLTPKTVTEDSESWFITYVLPWEDTDKAVPSQNPTNGLCNTIITVRKYEARVEIQPKPE